MALPNYKRKVYSVRLAGQYGIIDDEPAHVLPDNAWSSGQNVRFRNGKAIKMTGHSSVFGTVPISPYWMMPVQTETTYFWIYCGANKVYATDMSSHFNLTRQSSGVDVDYNANLDNGWNGGVIGGIAVVNNGIDDPQMWTPVNTGTRLQSLTYDASNTWATKGYTCNVMRVFKQYLIALNVKKGANRYEHLVKWSAAAPAGSVPATWDEADATADAGENSLLQSPGPIIDGLALKDTFVIYKEDEAWGMQYIGGNYVFKFSRLIKDGLLAKRCVKPFMNYHFMVTQNDVLVHDGFTVNSVIDRKRRSWLFNNIDSDNYNRSFVVPNYARTEMWICFPQTGQSLATKALIWNYKENTWAIRDLPGSPHIGYGVIDPGGSQTIDSDNRIIDAVTDIIDSRTYNPTVLKLLLADSSSFYEGDKTEQFAGANMTAYIERQGITFGDSHSVKRVTEIWPHIESTGTVRVYVGKQDYLKGPLLWDGPYDFNPDTDKRVNVRVTGRFIAVRFESIDNVAWSLDGYDMVVQPYGVR